MNNASVQKFKSYSKKLNAILNKWDPIGVLPNNGGPKDEYECLIVPIINLLEENPTKETLVALLTKQLTEHFGINSNINSVERVADKILVSFPSAS